ncbi:PAS domain-containing protein [Dongia deserti]|uniref:PAS domain-containing protein n=1 Tax=Dongia deserti TaxID=2268030 RepID=UPI000E65DA05|nr:PAS domain-containing protein [Dongia deserti]
MESSDFRIETPPIVADERLRSLYEYWHALAVEARGLPSLQAFDPLHLPKLIPNLWIMEVEPDTRRFRMRLAGESINLIYRRNIGGQYFNDVFERTEVDLMVARYTRALGEPCIVCAVGAVYAAAGRFSQGERLALPMLGRSGLTDTMLGATIYDDHIVAGGAIHVLHNEPVFYAVRAANHRPPQIVGG